ncbi:MAG: N-acetylmuramic acid 6-phosphate etherase [Phycisphaerales bacterium]|jgi:N-acetylmuramic acid 6-phosphate etherase|nr:N-acetylmuramic acid 6-phosphate etherase [Phycisphaerales bacterium]
MTLPLDREHIATEQVHDETTNLDVLSTLESVELLASDHNEAIQAVQDASESIASFIDVLTSGISNGGRLIYFGCGTSGRLGVLDAAECPPTFQSDQNMIIGIIAGGDSSLRTSSEAKEDDPNGIAPDFDRIKLQINDTVLGIAAGGTTPWVLGGLEIAKKIGAMTAFLTCSDVTPEVDHLIQLKTGAEPLTGSTRLKAGTATKLTLNIITTTLFTKLGKVYGNLMVDLKASNSKLLDRAIRIVSTICEIDRESSSALLASAGGEVKVAIVMYKKDVEATRARTILEGVGGNLRAAL